MPKPFRKCAVFLDCLRLHVARPSENQELYYNGWVAGHSITHVVVTSPCGLILCCPTGLPGHHNDPSAAAQTKINKRLASVNVKAMADKGFFSNTHIHAFARSSSSEQQFAIVMKHLSAIRTAGCEWPYGHLKSLFPYLVQTWKQKVYLTAPEAYLIVAMISANIVNLIKGRENHLYFDLDPPMTPEDYVAPQS
jgi:hypothetical protein